MANLIIRKKSGGIWEHYPSDAPMFILSNFYVKVDLPYFQIQEIGGSQRKRYLVSEISLYDDTVSGAIENFTSLTGLMQRLKILNYPPFSETTEGGNSAVANGFSQLGNITKLSNVITVGFNFQWFIYQNSYANLSEFIFNINLEPDGYSRKDIIVANTSNGFELIQGISSLGENTAFQPLVPIGKILLTEIEVFGNTIANPSNPVVGGVYLEKAYLSKKIFNGSGVIETLAVNEKVGHLKLTGPITSFGGIQRNTSNYVLGLPFFIEASISGDSLIIKHLEGNPNVKFSFPNGLDFTLPKNSIAQFLQTFEGGIFINKFIGVSSSVAPDLTDYYQKQYKSSVPLTLADGSSIQLDASLKENYIIESAGYSIHGFDFNSGSKKQEPFDGMYVFLNNKTASSVFLRDYEAGLPSPPAILFNFRTSENFGINFPSNETIMFRFDLLNNQLVEVFRSWENIINDTTPSTTKVYSSQKSIDTFVAKQSGKSLILDTEIARLAAMASDANAPVSTPQATADALVLTTAKNYADGLVVGLLDDRGNYNPNTNTNKYPTTGGSGTSGAILKGDLWSINGLGSGVSVLIGTKSVTDGDVVRALSDSPAQVDANWTITENNFGYTAENTANKSNSLSDVASTTKFPVWAIVVLYVTNFLASFKVANFLDATSSIQSQINSKQTTLTYTPYNATNPSGFTANSTDAQLRDRTTHTGVQLPATITQDINNRFVSDAEKTTWNGKQASLGFTPDNPTLQNETVVTTGGTKNNQPTPTRLIRFNNMTTPTIVSGFDNPTDGKIVRFYNSTLQNISILHESSASLAVNRLFHTNAQDLFVVVGGFVEYVYVSSISRWVLMNIWATDYFASLTGTTKRAMSVTPLGMAVADEIIELEVYDLARTTAHTKATINTAFPLLTKGQMVICPNITTGGITYKKYDDSTNDWLTIVTPKLT